MNILITSAGRRTALIEYFKEVFESKGEVHATDMSPYAPALYYADVRHIVPRIDSPEYVDCLLEICKKNNIRAVLSLIDPELSILAENKHLFEEIHVMVIGSPEIETLRWFDKYRSYQYLESSHIITPKTFIHEDTLTAAILAGEVQMPLIMKPRFGSASMDVRIVSNREELNSFKLEENDMILQERIVGREFGVDFYVDMLTGELIDLFIKEKLAMRAGETDKARSVYRAEIVEIVKKIVEGSDLRGPVDMDILEKDGIYYVLEVNPRFGGGYPMAYELGKSFPQYILNNMRNKANDVNLLPYKEGIYMLKNDRIMIIEGENDGF